MSLCENFSELARELRTAAGTVLTIVGSRLEADARARVDEVGPQWLNEFEAENDGMECTCEPCPLRDEDVCDEAEAVEVGEWQTPFYNKVCAGCWGPYGECHGVHPVLSPNVFEAVSATGLVDSSAAVSAAADPSPATTTAVPGGAGDEGSWEVSDILPSASREHLDQLEQARRDVTTLAMKLHRIRELAKAWKQPESDGRFKYAAGEVLTILDEK